MKLQFLASLIPLLGCSLLAALPVLRVAEHLAASSRSKMVLMTLTIGLSFISIDHLSVAVYMRGMVADLSITTIVMLIAGCYASVFGRTVVNATENVAAGCWRRFPLSHVARVEQLRSISIWLLPDAPWHAAVSAGFDRSL